MNFVKNQRFGFWAYLLVVILALVSLGMYVSNVNTAYYQDMNTTVVILLVCALACAILSVVLAQMGDNLIVRIVVDILRIAVAALVIVAGMTFVSMRVESFGYIYGSNLELGNEVAFSAGGQAITGIVMMVVTWVVSLVAAFLPVGKKA